MFKKMINITSNKRSVLVINLDRIISNSTRIVQTKESKVDILNNTGANQA